MGVKVNRCDIVPPLSGSAGVPVNAPYLLNGADPSGLLTAEVNVLALSAPQPFIATAPIFGAIGQPLTIAYDPGAAGAANTGAAIGFQAQNDADAAVPIGYVLALMTDATAGSVDSAIAMNVSAASATVTAALVDNTGILLDGSGAKTITTSKGNLTVSATGAGNGVAVSSAAAGAAVLGQTTASLTATTGAASVSGATTATLAAGTGDAVLSSTAGEVTVDIGALPIAAFVGGGMEFRGTGSKVLSYQGGDLSVGTAGAGNDLGLSSGGDLTITAGTTAGALTATGQSTASLTALAGNLTLATGGGAFDVNQTAGRDINLTTGAGAGTAINVTTSGVAAWSFRGTTFGNDLTAVGTPRKITNVAPATTTGDVVVFEQILDAGQAAPTNGGATVPIVPGAEFIATATFTAPTGGAGTFLLQNNTGRAITIIGARALIPAAGANTLALTIDNAGGTDLFTVAALAATGGTHIPAATTYTLAQAVIANGANIIITAEGSGATIDTILFLEFIVQ